MRRSTTRNIVVGSLCAMLIMVGAYAPTMPTTPKAHAFVGAGVVSVVGDIPSEIQRVLDGIGWMAAKTVVNSLTQSIVNWINSGFQGSPAFVTDLNRNLGNLGDAIAEDFVRGLDQVVINNTGFSIRAPFQDQIARRLREEYYRTTSSYGFDVRHPYRDCYAGRGFSLSGFYCQSQNPANNAIGRYQLARNDLFNSIDREAQNRIRELGWGKGFLSWRGPCGKYGNPPKATANSGTVGVTHTHLSQADTTAGCSIRTPGAAIEQVFGISATSPFRQLELADNINEIVAALMSQMVNQILGGAGLSGLSQPSAGGGASYLDRASDPSAYAQGASGPVNGIIRDLEKAERNGVTLRESNQATIRHIEQAIRTCTGKSSAAVNELQTARNDLFDVEKTFQDNFPKIPALRARITAAQASNANLETINGLVHEYQTLVSEPWYPSSLGLLEFDRTIVSQVNTLVREECQ